MIDYILMICGGLIALVLTIILIAIVWCIVIPGLILIGIKSFKTLDKFSDKLYSKFKTKE